jgi:uncharacterized protein YydD (DUF2326 family)
MADIAKLRKALKDSSLSIQTLIAQKASFIKILKNMKQELEIINIVYQNMIDDIDRNLKELEGDHDP